MTSIKSSKKYYYFYRYGFGLISIAMLIFWVVMIYTSSTIEINGVNRIATLENTWMFPMLTIIFTIVHFIVNNKAAYIEIEDDKIRIESKYKSMERSVDQIEKVGQIQFVNPPLYRLKMKSINKTFLFVINRYYLEAGGFIKDLSNENETINKMNEVDK